MVGSVHGGMTTLYRQLNRLAKGGALRVVAERQVRGAVEREYVLNEGAAHPGPDEVGAISREDYLRYFAGFVGWLLVEFEWGLRELVLPLATNEPGMDAEG